MAAIQGMPLDPRPSRTEREADLQRAITMQGIPRPRRLRTGAPGTWAPRGGNFR